VLLAQTFKRGILLKQFVVVVESARDKNIGCEYQGAQHLNSIDYFGGKESFEKQQERDKRKKLLCQRHSCKLLYVFEDYDFQVVRKAIAAMLSESNKAAFNSASEPVD
jgi:hypothetical protein